MREVLLALVALVAAAAIAPPAGAAAFHPCPSKTGFDCTTVWVPLDRTGVTPGRIPLRVERLRAGRQPYRGVFIFLSGGPGQEGIFDTDGEYEQYLQGIAPGWDIVSVDQRGTGRSGVLRCEGLEEDVLPSPYGDDPFHDAAEAASQCANDIGAAAAHYATADTVADLEAAPHRPSAWADELDPRRRLLRHRRRPALRRRPSPHRVARGWCSTRSSIPR